MKYRMSWLDIIYRLIAWTLIVGGTYFLLTEPSRADQLFVDGGVGVFNSGKQSLSETKMLTIGDQETLDGALKDRLTVGGWLDNAGNGKSGSALASGQLGFEVNHEGTVFGLFTGPTEISNTDILLGGHFQFMDELHYGIQDKDDEYLGIMYRHLSSAGIEMPNIGRDIVGLELRF